MPQTRFDASLYLLRARVIHMQLTLCLPLGPDARIAARLGAGQEQVNRMRILMAD